MDAAAVAAARCRGCDEDLEHCHGTFVEHEDGGWECTAPQCAGPTVVHRWVVRCQELGVGCCSDAVTARTA